MFQAVLPLRGKILNVERRDDAALYRNNEISNLIVALGLGLKGEDMVNLRYGKVGCGGASLGCMACARLSARCGERQLNGMCRWMISRIGASAACVMASWAAPNGGMVVLHLQLPYGQRQSSSGVVHAAGKGGACAQVILLTDADVDGAHIRTLLLTFLFRYARDLFAKGHVYVGVPPLYKLEQGRKAEYLYSEPELAQHTRGLAPGSFNIQRFKACTRLLPFLPAAPARPPLLLACSDIPRACMGKLK